MFCHKILDFDFAFCAMHVVCSNTFCFWLFLHDHAIICHLAAENHMYNMSIRILVKQFETPKTWMDLGWFGLRSWMVSFWDYIMKLDEVGGNRNSFKDIPATMCEQGHPIHIEYAL